MPQKRRKDQLTWLRREETSEAGWSSEEVAELEGEEVSSDGLNSFNYKSNTKSNTLN